MISVTRFDRASWLVSEISETAGSQKMQQQPTDLFRLFLLHPMTGALDQVAADHPGADVVCMNTPGRW
ncbi:MAG: hypothetical protein KGK01_05580 [Bradyrhizobium sp.]|uniref:hypothetical protein n=1 Tax=Bradyrhizobium sp. TaxID=376 RepID=UPI0023A2498E|nr:hypothetical protein [Bradyrhizobium sp.]MDE2241922.1 hypothetical protein [Bradyrhizobium sp.]